MPKPKKEKPKVLVFPPKVSVSKQSTRYDLYVDVKWGDFEQTIKLTKEAAGLLERVIDAVNKALLEASETTQPYL